MTKQGLKPTRRSSLATPSARHAPCDPLWRPLGSVHLPPLPSAEGDEILPMLDRGAELIRRTAHWGAGAPTASSTYRGQTSATELTAAQIAAHNPIDSSVIAVSDAILLSRTVACRSTRS